MIDRYARITIIIRMIAVILLTCVLVKQHRTFQTRSLIWLKVLMMSLVLLVLFGNVFSICLNLFRQSDGNLYTNARHISMIWNSLSAVAMGVILLKIYNDKE